MKRLFLSGRVAWLLVFPVFLLPAVVTRQKGSAAANAPETRASHFEDWSTRYVVYPHNGTMSALQAASSDPRAGMRWRAMERRERESGLFRFRTFRGHRHFPVHTEGDNAHADWSISLGTGTTTASMFPATFTFSTVAPSCTQDFAVFPVNVNGSTTQPNLVGFNYLYSGTGPNGVCNRNPVPVGDKGTFARVMWSYNIHALAAGAVSSSPVLSLDGSRVAFVETATASAAHFHVLAWKSGDGVNSGITAGAKQDVTKPAQIATFSATAPVAASGTASDLALGSSTSGTNTISSPFVDYVRDTGYVGNDAGVLYRIKNVFCTLPTCGNAAPSIDTTWGSTGAVTVGSGSCAGTAKSKLTGAVLDFVTLNVFVGCADGKVYAFNSAGTPLAAPSIAVGNGSALGGVVDPPIVDGVNGFLYAVSGSNGSSAVVVQAKMDLSSVRTATVGGGGFYNLHAPNFNDPYFTSATSSTWIMYVGAFDATAANLIVYGVTFDASRNMSTGTPPAGSQLTIGNRVAEYSPLTEFKNGSTDWLFFSVGVTPPDIGQLNINTFPTAVATASEGNGTSAMVIDNDSASAQASSFYFATLGTNAAVKLTQAGLQ